MTKLLALSLVAIPLFAGCGTDTGNDGIATVPDLVVPPKPAADEGWQVITPIFDNVMPSMDYEVCTWTDIITDKVTDIRSSIGYQNEPPGHHVIMFYTTEKQPPGTQRVCNDSDMATFRFLTGAGSQGELNEAPGDIVYRVPAGAQLVVNHHYLNSTDQPLKGQSAINVYFADPTKQWTPSGYLAITNTDLQVAQGDTTQVMHAQLTQPFDVYQAIPHQHQWGKHEKIVTTHAGTPTTQFDLAWDPSYTFHPPENKWDPATPMHLDAGDTIDVTCEWDNTAGRTLAFGFEMCVAFFNTVDKTGQGSLAWDDGRWTPF